MYFFVVTGGISSSFKLRIYATVTHKMLQTASVNKHVSYTRALQLCVGVLVICVLVFTVCLYCAFVLFLHVYLFLFVLSVLV